jgi:hypothetical protein
MHHVQCEHHEFGGSARPHSVSFPRWDPRIGASSPGWLPMSMEPARPRARVPCRIVDAFQTSAITATNDDKLKDLVKIFSFSGELVTG